MSKKQYPVVTVKLDKIVGGGQTIGTLDDGRKIFIWGGLSNETIKAQITKKKSKYVEGIAIEIINQSKERVEPLDNDSYLSTSPWQIMNFKYEQKQKVNLIKEAFELQNIKLEKPIKIFTDKKQYEYRNKVEFSWYWDKINSRIDLAFFKRGSHDKIPNDGTALAISQINLGAIKIRDLLRDKNTNARSLKTLLVRCDQQGNISAQLYLKEENITISENDFEKLNIQGLELIFSNPKSPASVITKRLKSFGNTKLNDMVLNMPFSYTPESFFQINIPVYEQALKDIKKWIKKDTKVIDLYSGVGTIGLTVGNKDTILVEINESAFSEMKSNIKNINKEKDFKAILSPAENALEYIENNSTIIVDPPRTGLHKSLLEKFIEVLPERIIYLSCNPITQARDIKLISEEYNISYQKGYNFFPRTPHIENLIVLDRKNTF